jgi:hypothetical protein
MREFLVFSEPPMPAKPMISLPQSDRRLTEVERLRPAQRENAMKNSLTDLQAGRGKTLTK